MTLRICDGGEGSDVCEACRQAQNESIALHKLILGYFNGKKLKDVQQVKAVLIASLASIEVMSGEWKLESACIVSDLVSNWANLIVKSQTVDLKTKHDVSNIMEGNNTLN